MLQTEDAHMELCRALSVSKLPESCLKLRINKLDLSCLGVARIVVLLELLDPQVRRHRLHLVICWVLTGFTSFDRTSHLDSDVMHILLCSSSFTQFQFFSRLIFCILVLH